MMTRETREELTKLQDRYDAAMMSLHNLRRRVEELELEKSRKSSVPAPPVFRFGDRVCYRPASNTRWTGIVIPRPVGYPALSVASLKPLTYVLRDRDSGIRGCFASNLVKR